MRTKNKAIRKKDDKIMRALKKFWARTVRVYNDGTTQAGKINLKEQEGKVYIK